MEKITFTIIKIITSKNRISILIKTKMDKKMCTLYKLLIIIIQMKIISNKKHKITPNFMDKLMITNRLERSNNWKMDLV